MLPQWTPCVPHVAGAWKALASFPRLSVVTALLWSPLLLWGWVASMGGVSFWALSVLSQGQVWEELVPLSPQVSHIPVPGCSMLFRGAAERLRTRLGAVPSPAPAPAPPPLCSARPPSPPSRQGARWASPASGASRHLPLSFRGCRRHGGSASRHPPPSSGAPAAPRRGTVGADRRGPGREAVGSGGGRDGWGKRGLGWGTLGLGSAEPDPRPSRPPRVGTRSDEDGEESGAGDHREVLHAPRE